MALPENDFLIIDFLNGPHLKFSLIQTNRLPYALHISLNVSFYHDSCPGLEYRLKTYDKASLPLRKVILLALGYFLFNEYNMFLCLTPYPVPYRPPFYF